MMTLLLGVRASEIVHRVARDVDDGGKLLWIPDSKTDAGRRTLEVPAILQPYLAQLAKSRKPDQLLFGKRWRDWPRKQVQLICKAAGVMNVTAHGMRGLHSTIAIARGVTGHVVAAALGHESVATTYQSYARPEAVESARNEVVRRVLEGGKL